jgi:hypothetical protein
LRHFIAGHGVYGGFDSMYDTDQNYQPAVDLPFVMRCAAMLKMATDDMKRTRL